MNPIMLFIHKTGSPPWFYQKTGYLIPWLWAIFLVLTAIGMYQASFVVPADYQQGNSFRIIYVHVPTAIVSQTAYLVMGAAGLVLLVWRMKLSFAVAAAAAPKPRKAPDGGLLVSTAAVVACTFGTW